MNDNSGRPVRTGKPVKAVKPARPDAKALPAKRAEQNAPKAAPEHEKEEKKTRGISRFTKVLIIWLILLTVVIAGGLIWFNGFLGKYEELYQASLPYHQADSTIKLFADQDLDAIWSLVKNKPTLTEFENDASIKKYLKGLIKDREFTYKT